MRKSNKPKITVIGGGTGSFSVLIGLKKYDVNLSAIVTMMDSGGSSGKLRDELGVLPPGDIRQCLVALAKSSRLLRDLFNYRFENGGLAGHTFGNIFLSALEKSTGSMKQAIAEVGKILRIKGKVIPVTFAKADLCVELVDGKKIIGETHIDVLDRKEKRSAIKRAYLSKRIIVNPEALSEIKSADFILIGPGDLYTSIIPNLLVNGVVDAIKKSKAHKIYVLNLMTKNGQTTCYRASDHLKDLERYLGPKTIETILINQKKPAPITLAWYKKFNEEQVIDDLNGVNCRLIRKNLIKNAISKKEKGDKLRRSFIRHDPKKLAKELMNIISQAR